MARPERNNVDYFPHPVAHKKKMFIIEKMFGNDGYAIWFKLLEELGKNNYHYIDLQKDTDVMYLSSICNVEKGVLYGVIDTLITFEEFDRGLWEEERILFNQNFINSIQDAYQKRRNNCVDANSLRDVLISKGRIKLDKIPVNPVKGPVNPQRKLKESKLKESKENFNENPENQNAIILTQLLYDLIKKNNPNFKNPNLEKWAEEIDRIIRLDKRPYHDLEKVITWCQKDDFWKTNILSPKKLRKQYDQLWIKMQKTGCAGMSRREQENRKACEEFINE